VTSYTATQLRRALRKSGLNVAYAEGWDSRDIDPFGVSPYAGVVMHHTANGGAKGNNPSLYWQIRNEFYPVRAAHVNIGRDGLVTVIAARGAYHAGACTLPNGGMTLGGQWIPSSSGNKALFGIEIESKGTNPTTRAKVTDVDGYTPEQVKAASILAATICELMGVDEKSVINHKDWAPGRKNDTLLTKEFWRKKVKRHLRWQAAKRIVTG
jgi:N-acetyl-anhydromuramyl-L-alanine amidase AmpD